MLHSFQIFLRESHYKVSYLCRRIVRLCVLKISILKADDKTFCFQSNKRKSVSVIFGKVITSSLFLLIYGLRLFTFSFA